MPNARQQSLRHNTPAGPSAPLGPPHFQNLFACTQCLTGPVAATPSPGPHTASQRNTPTPFETVHPQPHPTLSTVTTTTPDMDTQPASGTLPMINYRKDAKKAVKFTFMVAGELGTGKTTFINCLLDRRVMPHLYAGTRASDTRTLLFTPTRAVALPSTSLLARTRFDPLAAADEPGIALTETSVELLDDDGARLHVNIIDTPGFGDNLDNAMCYAEIEQYLRQQFDSVLAEETRIRRNPRFVDTRVHVLLYFIAPTGHGLRETDIQCMKRLAKYVNIIPVLLRADSFTERELRHFKAQVRVDIERFNVPTFQFDSCLDDYDDADSDLARECRFLTALQPFAVVASEQDFEVRDTHTGETRTVKARQYPWGLVDVNNPQHSDFAVLRSVLFGSHLQDLKDLTHDFLYETYRTERLSEVTGKEPDTLGSTPRSSPDELPDLLAQVPLMLNLAQLAAIDTLMLLDFAPDESAEALSVDSSRKNGRSMLYDENEDVPSADAVSLGSARSAYLGVSNQRSNDAPDKLFKRLLIAPQRSQLRQISETVPYVLRHERILERQQKLEEMEMVSAKELESRAALLEQKAAMLKAREKLLLEKLELYKKAEAAKAREALESADADSANEDSTNEESSVSDASEASTARE